jgi:hypothetical protein
MGQEPWGYSNQALAAARMMKGAKRLFPAGWHDGR